MKPESTTDKLNTILKNTDPFTDESVMKKMSSSIINENNAFSIYVKRLINLKGYKQQEVFLKAGISERYGYKLLSGEKKTRQRDTLLRIFYAAGFSIDEVDKALKLYKMPVLYPRFKRDIVLIIAFNKGIRDPYDVDDLLTERGLEPLKSCTFEE